ncbi:MAG: hypothetical protein J5954_11130 [Prevotella sp.]|nr:hypothetical protein [Prevotella sp.]
MKQINFFKKTLLLVAMVAGVNTAWADTQPIPQDLGSYIVIGSATGTENFASYISTKTNCTIDANLADTENSKYYTIGTSQNAEKATLAIDVTTSSAGDYLFGFKTGAGSNNGSSTVNVTIKESGASEATTIATGEVVPQDGNWTPTTQHLFYAGKLKASTTYTITVTATKTSGSYCGNFGHFYFHNSTQYSCTTAIESAATTTLGLEKTNMLSYYFKHGSGGKQSGGNLGYIQNGDYVEYLLNNPTAQSYVVSFEAAAQQANDQITVALNNLDATATSKAFTITNNGSSIYNKYFFVIDNVKMGLKTLKVSFSTAATYAPDLKNLQIIPLSTVKQIPTSAFDISTGGTFTGDGKYDSDKGLDSFKNGNTVTFFIYNSVASNTLNMTFDAATPREDAKLAVSFTDGENTVATATVNQAITKNGDNNSDWTTTVAHSSNLSAALPVGCYYMTITMTSSSGQYTANVKNIAFTQIAALNENSDYTPEAGYANVTLTRSITADKWSTICLPFAISKSDLETAFGTTVTLAGITGFESNTITTESLDAISANVPCFIKVADNVSGAKTINGVTIATGTPEKVISGSFKLVGTYTPGKIASGNYFFSNNQLYKSTGNSNIKSFRAYFTGDVPAGARIMFFDDETTGISDAMRLNDKGQMTNDSYFDLQGRRVAQPAKGLYIVNGKKVIIK